MLSATRTECETQTEANALCEEIEATVLSVQAGAGRERQRFRHLCSEADRLARRADRHLRERPANVEQLRHILLRSKELLRLLREAASRAEGAGKMSLTPSERRPRRNPHPSEWCRPL